jgi:hypothetical protein
MIKVHLAIFIFLGSLALNAQEKSFKKEKQPYYPKEEIIQNGKRYRIHNSYLTIGGGFLKSSMRTLSQKTLGVDFHFPVRRLNFQIGGMMSGEGFTSDNNDQLHVGYGLRKEGKTSNLAGYIGPTYFWGVTGDIGHPPVYYQGWGGYVCLQAVTKFIYDVGLGAEVFAEVSQKQSVAGFKIIVFFSGAYRGVKKNYNPNVRSENPDNK